jgi:hypothetical protein
MSRGPANLGTGHHQAKMLRLDVLAARLEGVCQRRSKTGLIAAQAFVDACLHFLARFH